MRWTLCKEQFQDMENKLSKLLNNVIGILWEGLANSIYIHNHTSLVNNGMMGFTMTSRGHCNFSPIGCRPVWLSFSSLLNRRKITQSSCPNSSFKGVFTQLQVEEVYIFPTTFIWKGHVYCLEGQIEWWCCSQWSKKDQDMLVLTENVNSCHAEFKTMG